ncbi:MAG: zinc ribbon domain-containing protein [Deltaproteobacteria bacterium]|nr:MAG: zinc ribbon domain-containing protein [Deltaproteobacteria bacterium]
MKFSSIHRYVPFFLCFAHILTWIGGEAADAAGLSPRAAPSPHPNPSHLRVAMAKGEQPPGGGGTLRSEKEEVYRGGFQETGFVRLLPRPAWKPGGICFVCGEPVEDGKTFLIKGRRLPAHTHCLAEFEKSPERYFARVQPRAALFHEEFVDPKLPGNRWIYAGVYVVFALLSGALAAYVAVGRGHSPTLWFFTGVLLNLLALPLLLIRPRGAEVLVVPGLSKVPLTAPPLPCPECGHGNHPSAAQCPFCHHPLEPRYSPETSRSEK